MQLLTILFVNDKFIAYLCMEDAWKISGDKVTKSELQDEQLYMNDYKKGAR